MISETKVNSLKLPLPTQKVADEYFECEEITNDLISLMKSKVGVTVAYKRKFESEEFAFELFEIIDEVIKYKHRLMYNMITNQKNLYDFNEFSKDIEANIVHLKRAIHKEMDRVPQAENTEELNSYNNEKDQRLKVALKIYDHYLLLLAQSEDLDSELKKLSEATDISKNDLTKLNEETKKQFKIELDSFREDMSNSKLDQISILGVFTGISFVTFGGLSLVSDLADNIKVGYDLLPFTYSVVAIGMVLINALVILMQYIKSMTKEEVRVSHMVWKNGFPGPLIYIDLIFIFVLVVLYIIILKQGISIYDFINLIRP